MSNSFGARATLKVGEREYEIYRLDALGLTDEDLLNDEGVEEVDLFLALTDDEDMLKTIHELSRSVF